MKSPETLLDQDFGLVTELVRAYAAEHPRRPALIDEQRSLDYGELDQKMDRIAVSLQRDAVSSGDAIAICAASCVDYAVVFFGALRAGVAVAPLSPASTPESLLTMLVDSGARILFLDQGAADLLAAVTLPPSLTLLYAALLEHDIGELLSRHRRRRRRRLDGQVRGRQVPRALATAPCYSRHAGARSISTLDGSTRLRQLRPRQLPRQVMHQRAVCRRAQGGHPASLAGRSDSGARHPSHSSCCGRG